MLYDEFKSSSNNDYDFLAEAIIYTLQKYNIDINNRSVTKNYSVSMINSIIKREFNVISSDNNHRLYVSSKTRDELVKHMLKYTALPYLDINEIIPSYSDHVASLALNKKETKDSVSYEMLCQKIDSLNLNIRQKDYLKQELQNGNIDILRGLISDDLLNSYINSISNTSFGSK